MVILYLPRQSFSGLRGAVNRAMQGFAHLLENSEKLCVICARAGAALPLPEARGTTDSVR
jgi:hypothetical protein